MTDPYNLHRFVEAQDAGDTYATALEELRAGRKRSHWMWFVFPQIAGLGSSLMARTYAISSAAEADAYLRHPVLGPRLLEAAAAVAVLPAPSAADVLGAVDAVKLRSSMTLFARAAPHQPVFQRVLDRFYDGVPDEETDRRL
ncbi:DUF1810 domain-containing protein [Baekduia soli]|uniref:DUF1810 domain-containing protein n=1 Tax=Baekduia soli TaxID=496014 RepID=A0A5B8U982_9ACTN|nr:DUF1810 domain-containing protein [Baekduia soli]QEC49537.1 DUF1810 domain-containing protein [Baekduia soli]